MRWSPRVPSCGAAPLGSAAALLFLFLSLGSLAGCAGAAAEGRELAEPESGLGSEPGPGDRHGEESSRPTVKPETARSDPAPGGDGSIEPALANADAPTQEITFDGDDADPSLATEVRSAPKRPPLPAFRLYGTRAGDGP